MVPNNSNSRRDEWYNVAYLVAHHVDICTLRTMRRLESTRLSIDWSVVPLACSFLLRRVFQKWNNLLRASQHVRGRSYNKFPHRKLHSMHDPILLM